MTVSADARRIAMAESSVATTGSTITLGGGTLQFAFAPHTAHVSADPTRVMHCPFCGSGALAGRSDGGVDCTLCNRSFTVMEQPLFSNMPMADSGPGVDSTANDPLMQEDPFDAGPQPPVQPADPSVDQPPQPPVAGQPVNPPMAAMPLMTRNGTRVSEDDFLLHHALRLVRE